MKWPLPTALAATLIMVGAVWWRDRSAEPEPIYPLGPRSAQSGSATGIALPPSGLPGPPQQASVPARTAQTNVFPSQTWEPPPPPPPRAAAEPPPLPPHLRPSPPSPFRVISLWWDQNDFYVVLGANNGEEFPLCAKCRDMNFQTIGATLMGNYRVESIRPDGIDIVYLPNGKDERISLPGVASAGEPQ